MHVSQTTKGHHHHNTETTEIETRFGTLTISTENKNKLFGKDTHDTTVSFQPSEKTKERHEHRKELRGKFRDGIEHHHERMKDIRGKLVGGLKNVHERDQQIFGHLFPHGI